MAFLQVRDAERLRTITGPPGGPSYPTLVADDLPRSPYDAQGGGAAFADWDDDWQYPTLINGWANYNGSPQHAVARFRKLPGGQVLIQGLVTGGTAASVIFVLPTGYRPDNSIILSSYTALGVLRLQVTSSGAVYHPYSTSTSWHSIHCSFHPG